jgi:hypothetical protein
MITSSMSDVDIYSDSQEESVSTSSFIEHQEISDPSNVSIISSLVARHIFVYEK